MDNSSEDPIEMRLATTADVPQLTELLHMAYAELGARGLNFTAVDQVDEVTAARMQPLSTWVLSADGELLATATLTFPPAPEIRELSSDASLPATAWLNQLAVAPTRRGDGHARILFDHACNWARENGARRLGLDTAVPARHLRDLYERWGFQAVETIRWPGKSYESVVMCRPL